jgi:hypothetical protein
LSLQFKNCMLRAQSEIHKSFKLEKCALLGFHAAISGNFLLTFRDNQESRWVITHKRAVLIHFAAEVWNHTCLNLPFHLFLGLFTSFIIFNYSRTPLIRINWEVKPSEYAECPESWVFLWKWATVAVWNSAGTINSCTASRPFDHAWFEVLEAISLYCTWSDNR